MKRKIDKPRDKIKEQILQRTRELLRLNKKLGLEVAEGRKAEEAVEAERQRLYDVLETLPVYVVLLTPDYHVPFANRFFRERFGESHGKRCYEYLFKRKKPCKICDTYKVLKTKKPHHWEWTGPDNRNYDIFDFPFTDTDGSTLILEMGIDITRQKRTEKELKRHREQLEALVKERTSKLEAANEALRESQERMNRSQEIAHLGSWELDVANNHLTWSDEVYRIFGLKPQEFKATYEAFLGRVHPNDRKAVDAVYSGSIRAGRDTYEIEHRVVRKSTGEIRFVHERCQHFRDKSGRIIRSVGMVQDITERKKSEEKIEHLSTFPQLNPNPVIEFDATGKVMFSNLATIKTLRRLKAPKQLNLFLPDDFPRLLKLLAAGKKDNFIREINIKGLTFIETITVLPESKAIRIYANDITERKRTEGLLQKAHDELEQKVAQRTSQLLDLNKELNNEIARRVEIENQIRARNILLKLLNTCSSRKACADALVKLISKWTKCRCMGIRLLNEEGKVPYESYIGFSREFWEYENWLSLKHDECACTRVIRGKPEPVDLALMTKEGSFYLNKSAKFIQGLPEKDKAKFRGVCIKSGFNSVAVIPLRYQENIIGAIHLADESEGKVDLKTVEFIESTSTIIAEGIHKFNLEDKIRKDHALLDAFFQHSVSPFVFLDKDFNFIRVNKAYADACKRDVSEFFGHNHFEFYPDAENEAIFRHVVQTKTPYQAFARPFMYPDHPERGVTYWDWTLVPILDEGGEVFLLVFSLNDVTERKCQEEKLTAAHKELEQARRLSDIGTLAATVAHELRNPLAAIRMAAFNIKRKAQNPLLDKHLNNIETKISESDQIINNLLFYSRLRHPHYENINLSHILDECIENAGKHYTEAKASVKRNYKILRNTPFEADPVQMKELCGNILNNAYDAMEGKKGRIEVGAQTDGNERVKVYFRDSGVGMDAEHLKQAHEPFFTTKAKGTGLGLSVCFQIARLHNGDMCIESKKGLGTTVTVTLPVNKQTSQIAI